METRTTAEQFEQRLRSRPLSRAIAITENGLVMGAGTVLARMTRDNSGEKIPALDEDGARVFALLGAAYGRAPPPDWAAHLESAARFWKRGDKALANIRLAFARLPRIDDREGAYRLFLAETLLDDEGLSPESLMKIMGFESTAVGLVKYDPDQPRVPAGSGKTSGQWANGAAAPPPQDQKAPNPGWTGSVTLAAAPSAAVASAADPLFGAAAGSAFLGALGLLAETVGAAAVFGLIFVPDSNSHRSEGAVPGDADLRYVFDSDEGSLRLLRQTESGPEIVAVAHQGRDGIFFEPETGTPIARIVGGSLVFDAAALSDATEQTPARSGAATENLAQSQTDQPQLCPDPGPDVPHGASVRAIAYQAQISALNNPQRPLPPGLAVSLADPTTGKRVVFDDCRESDGTMIEAKGPGFARLLRSKYFYNDILPTRWTNQAARQIAASGNRDLEWFFAEPEAAERARTVFNSERFKRIRVIDAPALVR